MSGLVFLTYWFPPVYTPTSHIRTHMEPQSGLRWDQKEIEMTARPVEKDFKQIYLCFCHQWQRKHILEPRKEKLIKLFPAYKRVMLHSSIFSQLSHFEEEGRKDPPAVLHVLLILFSFLLSPNTHGRTAGVIVCPSWVASAFLMHLLEILHSTHWTRSNPPWVWLVLSKWILFFWIFFSKTRG